MERAPLSWQLRRWTPGHIWYRCRLPIRRRRWLKENYAATRAFMKSDNARPERGPTLVLGDFSGRYGLARGAQYDLPYMREHLPDVEAADIAPIIQGRSEEFVFDRTRRYGGVVFLCQPDTYARILRAIDPGQIADAWRIGRWVWETPLFPSQWRFALDLVHELWTPSQFCADAFRTGTDLPIKVVPHQVVLDKNAPLTLTRADLGIADDVFLGLAIMDLQSCPERKNPWAHIRAWRLAFADDPKAVLVMKVRVGKRTKCVLRELEELAGHSCNIRLLSNEFKDSDLFSMQKLSDVVLSLHRSEGFGLTIEEGLALGKTVVATSWPLPLQHRQWTAVEFKQSPYFDWLDHYHDGDFWWADALIPSAAEQLRQIRNRQALQ